jgi:hypothetical protein
MTLNTTTSNVDGVFVVYLSGAIIGGDVRLARVGHHPKEVLQITRLVTLFEVFDKTESAIASFKRAAAAG